MDRRMDGRTDGMTDRCKPVYPSLGIISHSYFDFEVNINTRHLNPKNDKEKFPNSNCPLQSLKFHSILSSLRKSGREVTWDHILYLPLNYNTFPYTLSIQYIIEKILEYKMKVNQTVIDTFLLS